MSGVAAAALCYFWSRDVFNQIMLSPGGPVFRGANYLRCCEEQNVHCSALEKLCCLQPAENRNLVLFDFGAFDGPALSKWLQPETHPENLVSSVLVNEGLLTRFPPEKVHLVAVEPNPEAFESLRAAKRKWETETKVRVSIVEAAAALKNSTSRIRPPREGEGFFLRLDEEEGISTETVDTAALIAGNCKDEDVCICAFDVEGAEFDIVRDLFFKRPSVGCLCDVLIVEWHEMIKEHEEYLLVNDFGSDRYNFAHIPSRLLPAAVLDGAMRFMLETRDATCPTVYIGFRYDQAVFDI